MVTETQNRTPRQKYSKGQPLGQVLPLQSVGEPGAYICNWTGHLLRVPDDAITPGRSPTINILGPEELFVTKISENPYIPVTKARLLAADFDMAANF